MREGPTSHDEVVGEDEGGRETGVRLKDGATSDYVPLILQVIHSAPKAEATRASSVPECVMGSSAGHARPQSTTAAQRETRPNRSTEPTNVCQIPCCLISPILSDCVVCEDQDAATKVSTYEPSCPLQSSRLLAALPSKMYDSAGTRPKHLPWNYHSA